MIKIKTFGEFDIIHNDTSILEHMSYQERLLKLFKYLLIFEGQRLSPEKIIQDLYGETDYYDPKNTLRTQISRVRRMFDYDDFYSINHVGGYYIFRLERENSIDFKEFEDQLNRGNFLLSKNPKDAAEFIKRGLDYYQGELYEELNDDWIVPQRVKYNRLYIRSISNYLDILENEREYEKVIEISEEAIKYHPYEETLNIYYMKSLIFENHRQHALSHYEYFTSKMYKDLKIGPSEEIQKIHKLIMEKEVILQGKEEISQNNNSSFSKEDFERDCPYSKGILDGFHNDLPEEENIHRKCDYFIKLEVSKEGIYHTKYVISQFYDTISKSLRGEDGLYLYNENTILLKLNDASYFEIEKIVERVEKTLRLETQNQNLKLDFKLQAI